MQRVKMKLQRSVRLYATLYALSHITFGVYSYVFGYTYMLASLFVGLLSFNIASYAFMHRAVAHNQFQFSRRVKKFLCDLFSMCGFGSLAVSCAVHVEHHKHTDTTLDPHDFRRIGLVRTVFKRWDETFYPPVKSYVRYLRDPEICLQHRNNANFFLLSSLVFPFIPVVSFWMLNLIFIANHLGEGEGGSALNLPLLYPLMWGEEFHSDHHRHPERKRMHKFDLIYWAASSLERV